MVQESLAAEKTSAGIRIIGGQQFSMLNWLRFSLAIYLVLFHTLRISYEQVLYNWVQLILSLGNLATSIFFVLSGFLLTHVYVVQKNGKKINARNFLIARFSTLYPIHIVGLALAALSVWTAVYSEGGVRVPTDTSGVATRTLSTPEVWLALGMNIFLVNAWNPYYLSFNFASWSLSALAFYYLLFPAIASHVYSIKKPIVLLALLAVIFAVPGLITDIMHSKTMFVDGLLHRNPILRLPLFIAGMTLSIVISRQTHKSQGLKNSLIAVILITILLGLFAHFSGTNFHIVKNGLYLPASVATVWLCLFASPVRHWIKHWGERLGGASLPLFFLHLPLFALYVKAEKIITALYVVPGWDPQAIIAFGRDIEPTIGLYPVYLILLIITCVIFQENFVIPLQKRIREALINNVSGKYLEKQVIVTSERTGS